MPAVSRFSIPGDHPSLPGHFPGRPIVPGVLLLDEVLSRFSGAVSAALRLEAAKFTAPVLPDQEVAVSWSDGRNGRVAFVCRVDGREVLRGRVLTADAAR